MKVRLLVSISILIIFGFIGFFWLQHFKPNLYFNFYPVIPSFFILTLLISDIIAIFVKKRNPKIAFKTLAIVKTVKFLLCLIILIVVPLMVINIDVVCFLIVFVLFFVIHLILESWLLMKLHKE